MALRHVWERTKEHVDARRLTEWGKCLYARRKKTVERSFAAAKQLRGHGHCYARMGGCAAWPSNACWPPPGSGWPPRHALPRLMARLSNELIPFQLSHSLLSYR